MNTTPYIGLRPFERHETELFFGREQHSDELIARLGSHRFLAVIGNSGCGKSSLVKTGLIAGLEAGFLATPSSYWRIVEMRPGNHPFKALAEQLLSALQPELAQHYTAASLEQRLRLGSLSLHELLAEYPPANNAQLLIVCDQFEEVFRYAEQGAALEAALFVGLLLASSTAYPLAAQHISERIYVVITMRSDFLGDCAQFAGLAEAINQGLYLTPRLNSQQLRAAIEEPAFVCDGDIEPALVSQLLDDADTNPDQLPLLQHSLMRLWDLANPTNPTPSPMGEGRERVPQLTLNHYHQLANAHESKHETDGLNFLSFILSNHADEVYNALSPRQQTLAEHLFRLLTAQDLEKRDTRRPQTLAKLVHSSQRPYLEVIAVLDVFRQPGCGFLLPPSQQVLSENQPDTIIDISHESLIRHWQRLKDWMADEAEQLKKYQRWLDEATRRQYQDGFTNLLESPELEPAEAWLSQFKPTAIWAARYTQNTAESILPEHQAADDIRLLEHYISLSRIAKNQQLAEQQQKLRLARQISLGASCGLLIAAGLAIWALRERQHAEHTEQQRTTELYQAQLTHAALLAKGEDYAGAKAILAKTYALDKTIPASKQHQRNLLASFSALKGGAAEQVYEGAGYPLLTVAVSPDGQTLAAAGEHGTLVIFEVATGKLLQRLVGHATEEDIYSIAYTPNGTQLISAGADKKIIVWQQDAHHQFSQQLAWQASDKVLAIAISPDGLTLASGGVDNNISLWALKTGKLKTTLKKHSQTIAENGLRFNATGQLLASASYDGTAIIWQVSTGQPRLVLQGHTGRVLAVAFSPDSQTVLTGSEDKSLRLWSVATGKASAIVLNGHNNKVFAAQFLGKGDYLLSGSDDRTLRLWDTRSGISLRLWQGHTSGIIQLATYANQLFSASTDGTVRRWELALPYQQNLTLLNEPRSAAISPDLSTVAVGFANGGLSLYNPNTGLVLAQQATAHNNVVKQLAFNRTGELLASGSFDYTAKIWRLKAGTAAKPEWGLQEQATLTGHTAAIHGLAFAPDSLSLATASYNGKIGLYNVSKPDQPQLFNAHEGGVSSVLFNNPGTRLLSSGMDDRASKWWAITTQPATLLSELPKAKDNVMWASLSPDQQLISRVGRELVVSLFNTQTQQTLALVGHEQTVYKSLFSPDSSTLATVSGDATVKFWTTDVGSELFSLRLPTNSGYSTPLWDFDFRCLNMCRVAVPLTAGRLFLYQFAYQDALDFNHDLNEQKRTRFVLWQDYLAKTSTLLQQNALAAAQQAYREADTLGQPLLKQYPDDVQIQQSALASYYLQAILHQRLGNLPAALSAYQLALASAEKVLNNSADKSAAFTVLLAVADAYSRALSRQNPKSDLNALQQKVLALPLPKASLLMARAEWASRLQLQAAVDKDLQLAASLADRSNALELNSVGYYLATLSKHYAAAYPLLKQAYALAPNDANIMDSVAWVLHNLGHSPLAWSYLQAATCREDQLSASEKAEVNAHKLAVLSALGKTKPVPSACVQVQVQNVLAASQAEALGILAGDVLLSYNGKAITNMNEFIKSREPEKPNAAPKKLIVERQGKTLSFAVKAGKIGAELKEVPITPPPLPEHLE